MCSFANITSSRFKCNTLHSSIWLYLIGQNAQKQVIGHMAKCFEACIFWMQFWCQGLNANLVWYNAMAMKNKRRAKEEQIRFIASRLTENIYSNQMQDCKGQYTLVFCPSTQLHCFTASLPKLCYSQSFSDQEARYLSLSGHNLRYSSPPCSRSDIFILCLAKVQGIHQGSQQIVVFLRKGNLLFNRKFVR